MIFLNTGQSMLLGWLNMGIMLGLTFGVLILLRPVTNRLLSPGNRVFLWMMGWTTWIWIAYEMLGQIRLLPVTFRSLVIPRTHGARQTAPGFLPEEIEAGVEATIALPGGTEIPFTLGQTAVTALCLTGVAVVVFALWWSFYGEYRFLRKYREGRWLTREELKELGVEEGKYFVAVKVCDNLPTSFVADGRFAGAEEGTNFAIFLQSELSETRKKLVLQHELQHIYCYHVMLKSYMVLLLILSCWNPVLWLAYRLTCRDMELQCDERVLRTLDEGARREYARTLVEMGSGKFLWGTVSSFGECDTAIRVKRAVAWKKAPEIVEGLSVLLLLGLFLFFYTGEGDWGQNDVFVPAENLVEAEKSWDGDNTVWQDYVAGPKLISDLQEFLDRPALSLAYGYEAAEGEIFTISYLGDRLHCTFIRDAEGVWQPEACEYLSKQEWNTDGLPHLKHWTTHR